MEAADDWKYPDSDDIQVTACSAYLEAVLEAGYERLAEL